MVGVLDSLGAIRLDQEKKSHLITCISLFVHVAIVKSVYMEEHKVPSTTFICELSDSINSVMLSWRSY